MKIIQLFKIYLPDNGGGIAKVMESIVDALPECEHQILVCQNARNKKSVDDKYRGTAVRRSRQMFEIASTPVSLQFLFDAREKTKGADIVICHFPYPMADLAVLLGLYSGRLIVWWHCGLDQYTGLAPLYRMLAKHTLKKADQILVSSKGNLAGSSLLWEFREKCRIVPFCVSDAYIRKGKELTAVKKKRIVPDNETDRKIRILFIGRLVWYKGCDVLLRAFARMKQKNCKLVVVGSGPLERELKCLADSLALRQVEFMGLVSEQEKIKQIAFCDFLVLPSISKAEAFAIVQLEAMAFGKPVINTALQSGVPYVSIHGETGITVEPGSIGQLARAMDELAGNQALRLAYGRQAQKRVQKYFTKQRMAQTYRQLFYSQAEKVKIAFDGGLLLKKDKAGIAWSAHNLILELLKYPQNECTIRCFHSRRMRLLEEYQKAGCRIECCRWFHGFLSKLLWAVDLVPYSLFFGNDADIIQFFNFTIPPGVKGKKAVFIHDMAYQSCPGTVRKKTRLWLELNMKKTCRRADCILTVSEFSKQEIMRCLSVPKSRVYVVPNAVDHTIYHTGYSDRQIQRALLRYGVMCEYFLYLGTIEPRKNLERLIAAYAKLCSRRKQVPLLVLAGKKGWLCEPIYRSVARYGLEKKVLFTGYVRQTDSPLLMCGAKAFVFPSLYEGFGMPPLEAMACGTPVITSNTTALAEVAKNAGIMVDPLRTDEICKAMERILDDDAYVETLKAAGVQRASEYTWARSAALLMNVYQKLKKDG